MRVERAGRSMTSRRRAADAGRPRRARSRSRRFAGDSRRRVDYASRDARGPAAQEPSVAVAVRPERRRPVAEFECARRRRAAVLRRRRRALTGGWIRLRRGAAVDARRARHVRRRWLPGAVQRVERSSPRRRSTSPCISARPLPPRRGRTSCSRVFRSRRRARGVLRGGRRMWPPRRRRCSPTRASSPWPVGPGDDRLPRPRLERRRPPGEPAGRGRRAAAPTACACSPRRRPTTPTRSARSSTSRGSSTPACGSRPTSGPRRCSTPARRSSAQLGRDLEGGVRHGPRPIDVDVLLLGDTVFSLAAPDAAPRAGD